MGQKGQKTMPEVADGHHGGCIQESKNGLDAWETKFGHFSDIP